MNVGRAVEPRLPWSGDPGARRLLAAVRGACQEADGLPARLAVGLSSALWILAEDPELARLLTVDAYLADGEALGAQREWIDRFGDLLREAAASDPRTVPGPTFLAPFLIGGVRFQIARLVLAEETSGILRLLPDLLEALLAHYFEPVEARPLARAAVADL